MNQISLAHKRNSTFEMIRVVAMSLIIIHHFIYFCVPADIIDPTIYIFINPFFYTGVNLFFLISGWFSIKLSIVKVLSFVFLVFFYDLVNIISCLVLNVQLPIEDTLRNLIFPVSASSYWFLKVYLFLMVFSPIINKGLQNLSLNYLRALVIILSIVTMWSGCIGGNISNSNGFSFGQGIYVYILGYYLHTDTSFYSKFTPIQCYLGYILLMLFGAGVSYLTGFNNFILYNSLSIIGGAVCLFIALSNFKFNNNYVNLLGAASVGCYMLQDGLFGRKVIYQFLYQQWDIIDNVFFLVLMFAGVFITFWILACLLNPLFKKISDYISKGIVGLRFMQPILSLLKE